MANHLVCLSDNALAAVLAAVAQTMSAYERLNFQRLESGAALQEGLAALEKAFEDHTYEADWFVVIPTENEADCHWLLDQLVKAIGVERSALNHYVGGNS